MIEGLLENNGGWFWLLLGLAMLGLELLIPGVFMMWVGLAAVAVGLVSVFGLSEIGWGWEAQLVTFAALAVLFAVIGTRLQRSRDIEGDEASRFNRPGDRLVGRVGPLLDPIEGGHGRMKVGDTIWHVSGPDLAVGTRVRVVATDEGTLLVEPAEATATA